MELLTSHILVVVAASSMLSCDVEPNTAAFTPNTAAFTPMPVTEATMAPTLGKQIELNLRSFTKRAMVFQTLIDLARFPGGEQGTI